MKQLVVYCMLFTVLLWAACYTQVSVSEQEHEKEKIRAVVRQETEAYYRHDFEAWKNTYMNDTFLGSCGYWEGYPNKVRYFSGFDTLKNTRHNFHYLPLTDTTASSNP